MELTFSELKEINETANDFREAVEAIKELPEWVNIDSLDELKSIYESGCAANAHVSVYYCSAKQIFMEYQEDIETVLENVPFTLEWDVKNESLDVFISRMLVMAIEEEVSRVMGHLDI